MKILIVIELEAEDAEDESRLPANPVVEFAWKRSGVEAVRKALKAAEDRGFEHTLSELISLSVEDVTLAGN